MKKHLSIYTDASFNCKEKKAAYAFCISYDGTDACYSNYFESEVSTAKDAEMLALGQALNYVLIQSEITIASSINIYMDNTMALKDIKKQTPGIGSRINQQWQKLITKLGSKSNGLVHVKAHTSNLGKKYEMNNWCDRNARLELRKLINAR